MKLNVQDFLLGRFARILDIDIEYMKAKKIIHRISGKAKKST